MHRLVRSIVTLMLVMCSMHTPAQGLKLFSPEQRAATKKADRIVMDFLERYFSELPQLKHTTVSTKMADDKVSFRHGKLSDLSHIADTMAFSITSANRFYEVEWKKDDKPFVTIVFPAQYDLLLGMQQEEAQRQLKDTILAASPFTKSRLVTDGGKKQGDGIYMAKNSHFEFESISDAVYYNKVGKKYQPYFDAAHPDYSAANLFHGLIDKTDYKLYVEQSVYGLKTISYTIPLSQWLAYCAEWGLKVYFGIEEQREDGLLALVIAESKEFGFNHMLSVVIPDKFVSKRNTVLKARMTTFIPNNNIKNLFQKEYVNHRKIKWQ
ncbi:MAG: hypothetical protein IJ902_05260 [Prevotella sp.]|nr:hypothetical protein [Prevotella sp.]